MLFIHSKSHQVYPFLIQVISKFVRGMLLVVSLRQIRASVMLLLFFSSVDYFPRLILLLLFFSTACLASCEETPLSLQKYQNAIRIAGVR